MILYTIFAILILLSAYTLGAAFFVFFAIAIATQLAIGVYNYLNGEFSYFLMFEAAFYPIILIAVTTLIYRRFLRINSENDYLKENYAELERRGEELLKNYNNEKDIRINLEKRILKDDSFAIKLQYHVSSLASLNPHEIKAKLLEIVCEFIDAKSVSFYSYKNETFYFEKSFGDDNAILQNIEKSDDVYNAIISSVGAISVKDALKNFNVNIIIAGVLRDAKRLPLGLIAINKIDFLNVNYTTIQLFSMLCNWASVALEKAESYELALQESIMFEGTHILNMDYFLEVFNREVKLSKRYKSYFSTLIFRMFNIGLKNDDLVKINSHLRVVLRDIDSIYINHKTLDEFFITMQMTDYNGALSVKDKIIRYFEAANVKVEDNPLKFEVIIFCVDSNTPNENIEDFVRTQLLKN